MEEDANAQRHSRRGEDGRICERFVLNDAKLTPAGGEKVPDKTSLEKKTRKTRVLTPTA